MVGKLNHICYYQCYYKKDSPQNRDMVEIQITCEETSVIKKQEDILPDAYFQITSNNTQCVLKMCASVVHEQAWCR